MIKRRCPTSWAKIYIAGPLARAEDVCREYVESGACVNVYATNYIFKYGEQPGVVVEFINYPRFPQHPDSIMTAATELGHRLMLQMNQGSFTIQTPDETVYFDRREN